MEVSFCWATVRAVAGSQIIEKFLNVIWGDQSWAKMEQKLETEKSWLNFVFFPRGPSVMYDGMERLTRESPMKYKIIIKISRTGGGVVVVCGGYWCCAALDSCYSWVTVGAPPYKILGELRNDGPGGVIWPAEHTGTQIFPGFWSWLGQSSVITDLICIRHL